MGSKGEFSIFTKIYEFFGKKKCYLLSKTSIGCKMICLLIEKIIIAFLWKWFPWEYTWSSPNYSKNKDVNVCKVSCVILIDFLTITPPPSPHRISSLQYFHSLGVPQHDMWLIDIFPHHSDPCARFYSSSPLIFDPTHSHI